MKVPYGRPSHMLPCSASSGNNDQAALGDGSVCPARQVTEIDFAISEVIYAPSVSHQLCEWAGTPLYVHDGNFSVSGVL
jgi:hypothetical protein